MENSRSWKLVAESRRRPVESGNGNTWLAQDPALSPHFESLGPHGAIQALIGGIDLLSKFDPWNVYISSQFPIESAFGVIRDTDFHHLY
jgi:hypothetical protein